MELHNRVINPAASPKVFGMVDILGLLLGVIVVVAGTSDNAGGIALFNLRVRALISRAV